MPAVVDILLEAGNASARPGNRVSRLYIEEGTYEISNGKLVETKIIHAVLYRFN